jgi:S1-C subfamily serine protease
VNIRAWILAVSLCLTSLLGVGVVSSCATKPPGTQRVLPRGLPPTPTVTRFVHQLQHKTITLLRIKGARAVGFCAGTVLRRARGLPLLAITAAHCVDSLEEGETIRIWLGIEGHLSELKVHTSDPVVDLALLAGTNREKRDGPSINVSRFHARKGEPVVTIGSPHGYSFNISHGIVSDIYHSRRTAFARNKGLAPRANPIQFYRLDVSVNPGNSGGGLFNRTGELVGVVVEAEMGRGAFGRMTSIPHPGSGHAISLFNVQEFLREIGAFRVVNPL